MILGFHKNEVLLEIVVKYLNNNRMLGDRYKQFKDDFRKEAEWQRELREEVNKERQQRKALEKKRHQDGIAQDIKKIKENAQAGKLNKIKNARKAVENIDTYVKPLTRPWSLTKYMGKEGDGWYFVIFVLSVIFDLMSLVTGGVSGAVSWVPVVNGLAEGANIGLVFLANAVIVTLYLLIGHYKRTTAGRQFMKILAQFGFSFLELLPGVAILPGFIGAFLVNYWLVLYSRAVEDFGN